MTGIGDVLDGRERWTVAQGDCLDVLRSLPDASVDLVLTDPPYGTTRNRWDTSVGLDAWWPLIERVAKPNAAILMFAQTPFDKALGASRLPLLRYEWIWEKNTATGQLNARRAPLKAHENVLVFYRSPPPYCPQKQTTSAPRQRSPGAPQARRARDPRNYGARGGASAWKDDGTRFPRSVLRFPAVHGTESVHPTQKPVDLLAYFARTYGPPGGVVLDPFAGSGTTGVACMREGLRFIGVEREPEYAEIARARIAHAATQVALPLEAA